MAKLMRYRKLHGQAIHRNGNLRQPANVQAHIAAQLGRFLHLMNTQVVYGRAKPAYTPQFWNFDALAGEYIV
jgi:hypothetical protein